MKERLLLFFHDLSKYDYIFFISLFILVILLILLILLLRKRTTIALTLLLVALLEISLGPTIGYRYFHNMLYKNSITVTKAKRLTFVQAVVVEGHLKNSSKFDFKSCRITAKIVKNSHNKLKDMIFRLKPIVTRNIIVKDIPKGADVSFKFLIEPFRYEKDFNISVSGTCK